jgi:hypothetical protein
MTWRFFPQSQPGNGLEMGVEGNDDGARFQGMRGTPHIVNRQRFAGLSQAGFDKPEDFRCF